MNTLTFLIMMVLIYGLAILCTLVDWRRETEDLRHVLHLIFGREKAE